MSTAPTVPALTDQLRLDSQNPWPGLAAFTEQQQDFFLGRKEEANELFRCIKRERITVLFGKSGLGKTSLLQAGLFPLLRHASFLPVYLRLSYAEGAPSLEAQALTALENAIKTADLAEVASAQPGESIWEYLHRRGGNLINYEGGVVTPVLIFDQFEEWFTLGARKDFALRLNREFLPSLTDLIENRTPRALSEKLTQDRELARRYDLEAPGCRILVTLREDYLANLENLRDAVPSLVFVDNRMRLTEMNGRQAFAVVSEPNPDLVDADVAEIIVRFVAGAYTEGGEGKTRAGEAPLEHLDNAPAILSLFCRQLNEERIRQGLPKITRALVAAQGVTIIEDFYKQCIAGMHPAVQRLIEDRLLTKAGYRDNIDLAQAKADLQQAGAEPSCIDDLVRLRLLQVEEHRGVPRLELTHDVLAEPVKRSRDTWEEQQIWEKKQQEERDALARAKLAEQEALTRARFLQKVISAVTLVVILLAALVVYSWFERREKIKMASVAEANEDMAKRMTKQAQANAAQAEANAAQAEASEQRAEEHEKNEQKIARRDEADKKIAQENEKSLAKVSLDTLEHCVSVSKVFYKVGGQVPAVKDSFFALYEVLMMGADQCFDEAQTAHNIAPDSVDITDPLTMIPLRAADSARQRGDAKTVREYRDRAVKLAESLQKEKERHGVKILVARTYVLAAYELATADEETAKADEAKGMRLVGELRAHSAASDFDDRDWDRLSQVYLYDADFLQALKKDTEATQAYEESFRDEVNAYNRKPSDKDYQAAELDRALQLGDYQKRLGKNDSALQWYKRSLDVAREAGDRANLITIYRDLRIVLVAQKKYDEAHALLDQRIHSLATDPKDNQREQAFASAYGDAAEVEEARKQWAEAAEDRTHALKVLTALKADAYEGVRKDLSNAYSDLSWDELHAEQMEKGLADAQKGIELAEEIKDHSTLVYAFANPIKVLAANKRYDDAHTLSDQYIAALLQEPQSVDRDRDLASAYSRAAEVEEARKQWQQAADYRAHTVSALAALKTNAYEGAGKDLATAYADLSWAEIFAGQPEKGLTDIQKGIAAAQQADDNSSLEYIYVNGIKALTANQDYEGARKISDQYIAALLKEPQDLQRDRDLANAYGRAAEVAELQRQWPQAADYRTHALNVLAPLKTDAYSDLRKDLAVAYSDLSWDEIHAGQVEKGLADTRKAIVVAEEIKDRPALASIYANAIRSLIANKSFEDARRVSNERIEALLKEQQDVARDRDLQAAYSDAVRIGEAMEDWGLAIKDYQRQVTILAALHEKHAYDSAQSDLASAYGGLSWAEIQAGRFPEGLEDAKKGLANDSTHTWINVNLAHSLLLTGKAGDARDLYFKIKDYPRGNRTLLDDIASDFKQLCKLGFARSELPTLARDLGINDPDLTKCFAGATGAK
jgi:tetratricopeptide (TPR) repeat protein